MSNICAISKDRYQGKSWRAVADYRHTLKEAIVPLVASELPGAVQHYPIAFVASEKSAPEDAAAGNAYQLVGVQGIDASSNLQVTSRGQWIGSYLPKVYRFHPFMLVGTTEGNKALCIDENAALISDKNEGEAFFLPDGEVSPKLSEKLQSLAELEKEKAGMEALCGVFAEMNLIEPWEIVMTKGNEQKRLEGLFKISETRLNELPAEKLGALRDVGGLVVAYCQLLSMQNMQKLAKQHLDREKAEQEANKNLQSFGLNANDGLLSFDNL